MIKKLDNDRLNSESEDDLMTFYTPVTEDFLRENADKITPNSFVYLYALSDEERAFVDKVRNNSGYQRVLKKRDK